MDNALRDIVVPELRERGFKGSLPHFRRANDNRIDLLTFQFDRHGGGFVIEIAAAPNETYKTSWGEEIAPNKLTAHDLNGGTRIHPKGLLKDSSVDDWFRYDKQVLFKKQLFEKIANKVIQSLDIAEDWWRNKA